MLTPDAPTDGKYRILIAEDDPNIARLLLITLAQAGLECRHAPDGLSALASFRENIPHLVLTDIMMPGLNGHELCAKIRDISSVPIIMMTAADTDEGQMKGFKAGADDYVPKPFNPKLMAARVVAHLRRVYRYDIATSGATSSESTMPPGWGVCDSCGYMGPRDKFGRIDAQGNSSLKCPVCLQNQVSFSIT